MSQTDPQVVALSSKSAIREISTVDDSGVGIFEALRQYRWSSLGITVAMVAITACVGFLLAPGAEATAVLALSTPPPGNVLAPNIQGEASLARYIEQRAGFVTSDAVLGAAVERLGREDLASLRSKVSANASSRSNAITITVTASSRADAVELADAVLWAYAEETEREVTRLAGEAVALIEDDVQALERLLAGDRSAPGASGSASVNLLNDLRLQALELKRDSELFGAGVEYVNAPSLETAREPGLPVREVGVGLILGLVAAGTVSWMRADHAVRSGRVRRASREGLLFGDSFRS
jgi:capsular polysaccharide biosynthesis protein